MKQYAQYVMRWPRATALLLCMALALALVGTLRLRTDPSNEQLLLRHTPAYRLYQQFLDYFGNDESLLVALHDPAQSLLTPDGLTAIRQLTAALAQIPLVESVVSLSTAPDMRRLRLTPYGVSTPRLIEDDTLSPERRAALRTDQLVTGTLLSADQHTAGFLVLPESSPISPESRKRLISAVRNTAQQYAREGRQTYVAGTPIERSDVTAYLQRDQRLIVPLVFLVLLVLSQGFYRSIRLAMIPLLCVMLSLVWTMGIVGFSGIPLNLVTSLLPPVVLVVSIATSMHLLNQFQAVMSTGIRGAAAVEATLEQVGMACLLAALTTSIGFFSLLVSPVPAVQEFACFAGLGVLVSFVAAMTCVPLALCNARHRVADRATPQQHGVTRHVLEWFARSAVTRRKPIFTGCFLLLIVVLPGLWHLSEGTDIVRALQPHAPLRVSTEFIDRHLTGVNSLELLIEMPHAASLTDPTIIRQVLDLSRRLRRLPAITAVYSAWEPLRYVPQELLSQDAQLEVLAALLPLAIPLHAWLHPPTRTLRLSLRVQAMRSDRLLDLAMRVRQLAARTALRVSVSGKTYLLAQMSRTLVRTQFQSLGVAIVLILGSIALALRSWQMGLLAAIPNLLPPALIFGVMGWSGVVLSTATTMIASVSLGLIVDNTIHLLHRYRRERRLCAMPAAAMRRTLQHTGRAVVWVTLILTCGFWVGVLGSFKPTVHFSFFIGCTLLLALLADLLVTPAVLLTWERQSSADAGRHHAP